MNAIKTRTKGRGMKTLAKQSPKVAQPQMIPDLSSAEAILAMATQDTITSSISNIRASGQWVYDVAVMPPARYGDHIGLPSMVAS